MTTSSNLLPELAAAAALPEPDVSDVPAARAASDAAADTANAALSYDGVEVKLLTVPGEDHAPDVPVRLLRPIGAHGALPVLVAMHGGGFILGRAEDFDYLCLEIVRELGIAVVNVEYRLAPETPFPGALDDCSAVLRHVADHGAELGVDPGRIAVGGSSAGGGLAAGTVLRARDEGGPRIAFQMLLSPALDDRLTRTPPGSFDSSPTLSRTTGELLWSYYLGPAYTGPDDPDVSVYAAPARADDLSGLPPTYIAAMELDPMRDQDIDYAVRLLQAGVSVELHSHAGTFHGSVEFAQEAASSARIRTGIIDALGRALGVANPPTGRRPLSTSP
jgi:acetyl esterase/lipase